MFALGVVAQLIEIDVEIAAKTLGAGTEHVEGDDLGDHLDTRERVRRALRALALTKSLCLAHNRRGTFHDRLLEGVRIETGLTNGFALTTMIDGVIAVAHV